MEIEAIAANGCDLSLKELLTVKNDWNDEKGNLLMQLIRDGEYNIPDDIPIDSSRTKAVINSLINFLKK